ncbi:unnamed protein product [Calypogeia fissa]
MGVHIVGSSTQMPAATRTLPTHFNGSTGPRAPVHHAQLGAADVAEPSRGERRVRSSLIVKNVTTPQGIMEGLALSPSLLSSSSFGPEQNRKGKERKQNDTKEVGPRGTHVGRVRRPKTNGAIGCWSGLSHNSVARLPLHRMSPNLAVLEGFSPPFLRFFGACVPWEPCYEFGWKTCAVEVRCYGSSCLSASKYSWSDRFIARISLMVPLAGGIVGLLA